MDMKSISQKLQDDIRAIMEANLHPNQQKIDVHEPEKDEITAHDFKKLRAMKKDQHGKITKEDTDDQIQELAGKAAQQAAIAISLIKAGKKDGKMPKPMKEDSEQVEEEEKKKVVSPFDYKNYKSEIPKKPGELTGHDSKKISTGTVYTKKPVKENTDIDEARKLEGTYTHTNGHESKVYKLSGEHNEGDPYHVKLFKGGKHYEPADYFTNDKDDAHSTAKHMVKEESHQSATTMKHIPNASPALKKAAKDIKPGIAGYRDRIAMLKAGGVKEEAELDEANIQPTGAKSRSHVGNLSHPTTNSVVHPSSGKEIGLITKQPNGQYHAHPSSVKMSHHESGTFDTKDQAHQHIRDAHAKAIKTGTLSDRWKKQEKLPQFAKEEVEQMDELSVNTLNRVHSAAVKSANDASRDGDEARADKRYNLAGKASNKAELKNRAAGLKPSGQHALESVEQEEYTFADYLEAARAQYVDEDAVLIANEAFKNQDITLFSDQSQSPEA